MQPAHFLKWQPCHFPVMALCFVVLIYLNVFQLSRGEICVANFKAPLQIVRVWTGYKFIRTVALCTPLHDYHTPSQADGQIGSIPLQKRKFFDGLFKYPMFQLQPI